VYVGVGGLCVKCVYVGVGGLCVKWVYVGVGGLCVKCVYVGGGYVFMYMTGTVLYTGHLITRDSNSDPTL
jgi:hypothetical protein